MKHFRWKWKASLFFHNVYFKSFECIVCISILRWYKLYSFLWTLGCDDFLCFFSGTAGFCYFAKLECTYLLVIDGYLHSLLKTHTYMFGRLPAHIGWVAGYLAFCGDHLTCILMTDKPWCSDLAQWTLKYLSLCVYKCLHGNFVFHFSFLFRWWYPVSLSFPFLSSFQSVYSNIL